uniref:G-protein coupled receptors family 3 profile domain-containing protein n=1 Tax=Globisporangium ultimum (strain ATCC 200006 / CBS 805.95 / DAOM BR144) TaxID=431595 RepID=K3X561_GLOUD
SGGAGDNPNRSGKRGANETIWVDWCIHFCALRFNILGTKLMIREHVGLIMYGAGAEVDADGKVTKQGEIESTLIVEVCGWTTHKLVSNAFSILAAEVYGYRVSMFYVSNTLDLTQRMSSGILGSCTPVHLNLEVWIAGIEQRLEKYANESYAVGGVGYFGRTGLYTTVDFINEYLNTTKHPSGPYFANFWKGYQVNDELIQAVSVSTFKNNKQFYPPAEVGCPNNTQGCLNHCSKSDACTARENMNPPKECLVVVMMYDYYDPGYLQAAMSNIHIPTYFCFIGYDATAEYALYAQKNNIPVLFYHYEPEPFHIKHAGLFDRVFLPRPIPERVVLATGTFGENGYGETTTNPVDVDFPSTKLTKYASNRLFSEDAGPIGTLISKFSLSELHMNDLIRKYISIVPDPNEPTAEFQAACQWLKENYAVWKLWLDRLPLCTFEKHIQYQVDGCDQYDNDTSAYRTILFSWVTPDPKNASLPYNCDGGLTEYPPPLKISRSCKWILADASRWSSWISTKPTCDSTFYEYNVSACDSASKRRVHYYWLLADPANATRSLECDLSSTTMLPEDVLVDCEYVPFSSPVFMVCAITSGVLIGVLVLAMVFVFVCRKAPIIKRSQFELLELMIFGGILVCLSAVMYAGEPTNVLCAARPLLVSSGFTTIFGALFVKSLRVYRVFMKSSMKRVKISTLMMVKVLSVFYVVDLIIIGVWFGADFPKPTMTREPAIEFRGEVERVACHSESFIFSALLMFWKAIVLALGIYISFLIRNVASDFQESIWIFSSSVMVLVGCLVILPLAYLVDMAAVPFYAFLAGSLLICTTVVMSLMLAPKVFRLHAVSTSSNSSKYPLSVPNRLSLVAPAKSVGDLGAKSNSSDQTSGMHQAEEEKGGKYS